MKTNSFSQKKITNPVIASDSQAITDMNPNVPAHDEIARKAYFIYLNQGCRDGRDLEHWLEAETKLTAEHRFGLGTPEGVTENSPDTRG